jgi:hypothetical protein
MPICPLLSKSGEEPLDCLKQQCAWYVGHDICVIVLLSFAVADIAWGDEGNEPLTAHS